MYRYLGGIFIFLIGLAVGSFLNSVIYRLAVKDTALKGRSRCPKCKHALVWQDLIPVLSFIILRGKCRYCKRKISWQYPLVEISTALLFLIIFNFQFPVFKTIFLLAISCFLIVIFVYDLKHYIIPDKIIYPAVVITFIYQLFENLVIKNWALIENWKPFGALRLSALRLRLEEVVSTAEPLKIENLTPLLFYFSAAFGAALFFALIVLVSKGRWMGVGDIKLAFLMGLLLGWPQIVAALFLSFFLGAVTGVILVASRRKTMGSEVPFGPFLTAAAVITLFFGERIINWYWSLTLLR